MNQHDKLTLVIMDKGIGIEAKDLPHVFDKFYRVSQGDLHKTKGFGLGLSYVKMMTTLHKGEIYLESKPGNGSTISIQFPIYYRNKTEKYVSKNIAG